MEGFDDRQACWIHIGWNPKFCCNQLSWKAHLVPYFHVHLSEALEYLTQILLLFRIIHCSIANPRGNKASDDIVKSWIYGSRNGTWTIFYAKNIGLYEKFSTAWAFIISLGIEPS
jgi:hypothetical protein